jgi:hypothetical protein
MPWPLHIFGSSSHYIVFLVTLETMCHLSLGMWKRTLYLFVLFVLVCIKNFANFFCYVIDFILFNIHHWHPGLKRTIVRSIPNTGLRSSSLMLARVQIPNLHKHFCTSAIEHTLLHARAHSRCAPLCARAHHHTLCTPLHECNRAHLGSIEGTHSEASCDPF